MSPVFKRFGGLAAATGIAVLLTAAPSHATVADAGAVAPNATAIEYGVAVSPDATAIEYGL